MDEGLTLDRLWAGWRRTYVEGVTAPVARSSAVVDGDDDDDERCVFCAILASGDAPARTYVVWRDDTAAVLLNAYPYTSGHVLAMPVRHVGDLGDLTAAESGALWSALTTAVAAVKGAYGPDGINLGANLGAAAGAGIPGHLHLHCLPRWTADTNFMTSVAETRVLPESLDATFAKITAAWPDKNPATKKVGESL